MHELQARFHADGWLHPRIVFAAAKFDAGEANWDGATQSYQSFGNKSWLRCSAAGHTARRPRFRCGWASRTCRPRTLYINQGGLQLYQVPSGGDFARIPLPELYANSVRNATAVHLALAPLMARTPDTK
jgi:hypothetical protein